MIIILDYDETYTSDPIFWDEFITSLKERMHTIVCCTMRMSNEDKFNSDVIEDMGKHDVEIVYAALYNDKWDAIKQYGIDPKRCIWIDDSPMYIFMNRSSEEWDDL